MRPIRQLGKVAVHAGISIHAKFKTQSAFPFGLRRSSVETLLEHAYWRQKLALEHVWTSGGNLTRFGID